MEFAQRIVTSFIELRPNGPKIAEVMRQDCGGYALTLPLLGRTGRGPTTIMLMIEKKLPSWGGGGVKE